MIDIVGFSGNKQTKDKKFVLRKKNDLLDALAGILIKLDPIKSYFGTDDIKDKLKESKSKQEESNNHKIFLLLSNLVRLNSQSGGDSEQIKLGELVDSIENTENNFDGLFNMLKSVAKSFNALDDDKDDDDDDDDSDGEEEEEDIQETFKEISDSAKEIRERLFGIKPAKLAKFLSLKVSHDSPLYNVIEGVRFLLSISLDQPLDSIKIQEQRFDEIVFGFAVLRC